MQKLDMKTPNFTDDNIAKIAEIFPNCVTEIQDEKGNLIRGIDFDLLRQELSANIVEGQKERYQINWPGKREALVKANEPINKTLRPYREESVNFDTTQNLYIEGDNLEALKLLQESYLGKIKMIYIDPPYNTGKDFVYRDNFTMDSEEYDLFSGNINEEGGKLVANTESNGRFHSDWLSMMYSRLKLARNLLKDDGVILISIDDNEVHNLRKLCDLSDLFGETNFVSQLIWKSGRTAASHFTNEHEYVLCYAKNKDKLPLFTFDGDESISDRAIKRPSEKNPISEITFPQGMDFESQDKIFPNEFGQTETVKVIDGIFECKNGKLAHDVVLEAAWTMKDMIVEWIKGKEVIDQKGQSIKRFFFKSNGVLQYEKEKGTIHPKSIITDFTTKQGTNALKSLFDGKAFFDFPGVMKKTRG